MRYFKIGQDHRIPYSVLMTGVNRVRGYASATKGDLASLDRAISCYVNTSPVTFFPDMLDRQIYMVTASVKDVFSLFLPALEYKHCCLLDHRNRDYNIYYIPLLEVLDVKDGIERGLHLFRVADTKETTVVASLELVETLLRRKPTGMRIGALSEYKTIPEWRM